MRKGEVIPALTMDQLPGSMVLWHGVAICNNMDGVRA